MRRRKATLNTIAGKDAGSKDEMRNPPVVRSFSLPNGNKITSLRESTLRAGLKAASLALKTERALSQTSRVHWTLLDPEATDEEMLRMDDEGYVEVSAGRASLRPSDDDLEMLIKPLWMAAKPSTEAQGIRAEVSTAVDDPKYPQHALDYVPDYVWDLVDIAAQRGIDHGRKR